MEVYGVAKPAQRSSMNAKRRLFTLEHANRTLPLVRRIVTDIVQQQKKVSALEKNCHLPQVQRASGALKRLRKQYAAELAKLDGLVDELSDIGCELKDWQRGLVDFRTLLHGREVEFCWRLGEKTIEYWHEVGVGFPGRRPIDEEFRSEAVRSEPVT